LTGLALVLDVEPAGVVIADEDGGESGADVGLGGEARDLGGQFGLHGLRECFSVEGGGGHGGSLSRGLGAVPFCLRGDGGREQPSRYFPPSGSVTIGAVPALAANSSRDRFDKQGKRRLGAAVARQQLEADRGGGLRTRRAAEKGKPRARPARGLARAPAHHV